MPRRSKQLVRQEFKPGPIGWARRRVFPLLAKGTALLGIVLLGAWITGRALTDEHHWTQYLYWLPPIVMIGGAWLMLVLSAIFAALARRLGGLILRPVLLVLTIGCSLHLVFGVWHMHRVVTGSDSKDKHAIRVLHWNHGGKSIDTEAWGARIREMDIDIVLIANADWGEPRQALLEQFEYYAPEDRVRWVNYSYRLMANPSHFRVEDGAIIASRYPMTRTGWVQFGTSERQQIMSHSSSGLGWIMFAEFDLEPDRIDDPPMVLWFVDLPSNPTVWKVEEMRTVRRAIDSWDGSGWEMGRHVWERYQAPDANFPTPDLVVGDFNTPRGSASLDEIVPGYTDAFEAAGHGRGRTFVIRDGSSLEDVIFSVVDLHIDLTLVAPQHRVSGYRLLPSKNSDHSVQIADIVLGNE
ncbi:MAG: endonuclease/exonuclease/phosphatase family protein [Phycisphaerales bacterium JB052]